LPQSTGGAGMLWADFDNDGRLDLLANSASLPLLFLNKPGGFTPGFFSFPANNLGSAAVADINRDNFIDVIMVSPDAVRIFLNQSGTNFITAPVASIPKLQFSELELADLDNDGDLDLFISGQNSSGTYLRRLLINDAEVFRFGSTPLGNVGGSLSLSDFDKDGWLDIAFSGSTPTGTITNGLYHGLGAGLFQFVPGSDQFVPKSPFITLDIDSDAQPDLLGSSGKYLTAFLNDHGIFHPTSTSYDFTLSIRTWGDFDGDGLTDIIGTAGVGSTAGNALFKNQGDGHFQATLFPLPSSKTPAATLDLNNDGTLDLIATGRVFTNSFGILNAPPGPPRNLQATLSTNGMLLSWGPATDLNQPSGLTYNVRVGTSPGASDLVSASALPSGERLLLAPGNSGPRLFMILTNLTSSTYYWSVQAIDNSFAGGLFAQEQIVHLSPPDNRAPVITPDVPLFTGPEDTLGHVTFTLSDDHTLPENLKLRLFALDPNLIPFTNISLSTTGATGLISFLPITNRFGETQLEIQATDAEGLVGISFVSITISNINDSPKISAIPQQFSNGPDDPLTVQFSVSDPDDLPDSLNLSVTSSDLSTLPLENISFSGSGTNRSINLFTKSLAPANVDLAIVVSDHDGASATSRFTVAFSNRIFKLSNTSFPGVRSGQIAWGDLDNDSELISSFQVMA
jgi:hypothetical protein